MPTRIQLRRGTAAEWTAANPVLAEGEEGIELDTRKFKFGDGVTAWNLLDYASASAPAQSCTIWLNTGTQSLTLDDDNLIQFNAIYGTDTGGFADLANNRFVIPSDGVYRVSANFTLGGVSDGTQFEPPWVEGQVVVNFGGGANIQQGFQTKIVMGKEGDGLFKAETHVFSPPRSYNEGDTVVGNVVPFSNHLISANAEGLTNTAYGLVGCCYMTIES